MRSQFFGAVIASLLGLVPLSSYADTTYAFSCPESAVIKGSIHYSVIGRYNATFQKCNGRIVYDNVNDQLKSVRMAIEAKSIESNCPWCDKIVRSQKVLDADTYPEIVFKGDAFEKKQDGIWVSGSFDIHGVTKNLQFQFDIEEKSDEVLSVKGVWVIRRKDYNIIWNKFLDHGGVLVGENIAVNWYVKAHKI